MNAIPDTMSGVQLTGHGGPEKLVWNQAIPVPVPGPGQALVKVLAAGVNNTDINTRIGWYASGVTGATCDVRGAEVEDGVWSGALRFPRIQGGDLCGRGEAPVPGSVDVCVDVVGGPSWAQCLAALRPGGRLATSGAIAGPIVETDLRVIYLNDITIFGCTHQSRETFAGLVTLIKAGRVRPLVSKSYPLKDIATAQADFESKRFPGKLVLIP